MFTIPLLAATIMISAPPTNPDVCINVNGPCSIIVFPNGDMILSNGKEISDPIPEAAMEAAEEEWDRLKCMGR